MIIPDFFHVVSFIFSFFAKKFIKQNIFLEKYEISRGIRYQCILLLHVSQFYLYKMYKTTISLSHVILRVVYLKTPNITDVWIEI